MKRLIEESELTSAEQRLAALLQGSEPYQPNPFRKKLIRSRLLSARAPRRRAFGGPLIAAVLLVGTASAAAALSYRWSPAAGESATAPRSVPVVPRTPAQAVEAAPVVSPAVELQAAPIETPRSEAPRAAPRRPQPDARTAGEDPTQVLEAVRALRKQGDAAKAQALLDRYLDANPRGALSEDALALSIEAAAARKDPRAAVYARRYLERFPHGRFRNLALRAAGQR